MTAWPVHRLGDLCEIVGGGTPSRKSPEFYGGTIPWLTVKDLKSHSLAGAAETITELGVSSSATRVLPVGTVIVATRITVGAVGIARVPLAINQDLKGLTAKENVNPEYVAWFVRARHHELNAKASGSTVKGITTDVLANLPIPLPPLEEQRRIVAVLDRAASIRRRLDASRANARTLVPALFLETFGDPATNPKGWPILPIGKAGEVKLGRQRSPKYQTGKFSRPYVRVANVFENRIDVSDVLTMDFDEREFVSYKLAYGDILLNEGQSLELVGRPAMWRNEIEDCCYQNTLVRFRCDPKSLVPEFALAAFLRMYHDGHLSRIASKTSNVAHLGAGRFADLPIVVPPLPLQTAFAEQAARIESLTMALDAAATKAETLAASLSAEVFGS